MLSALLAVSFLLPSQVDPTWYTIKTTKGRSYDVKSYEEFEDQLKIVRTDGSKMSMPRSWLKELVPHYGKSPDQVEREAKQAAADRTLKSREAELVKKKLELEAKEADLQNQADEVRSYRAEVATAARTTARTSFRGGSESDSNHEDDAGGMVYVTSSGSKYHREGCRYLKSSRPISLEKAEASGYSACSVCGGAPSKKTEERPAQIATFTARTTAPGVHVGPRGGIYHYSASGKKVYHKRK